MRKQLAAECMGTFFLVFAGTGAIVVNSASHGAVGHLGVALTFGMVVFVMIQTFGDISGAHFNPAVTLGFAVSGRFCWRHVPKFVAAQLIGALCASFTLALMFPDDGTLGITVPTGSPTRSFVLEFIMTAALMMTILMVSQGAKEKGITAGIAIGSLIGLEALFAGPICGASMNPARSVAPAIASQHYHHLWIYLVAPICGALAAVPVSCWMSPQPQPCFNDSGC